MYLLYNLLDLLYYSSELYVLCLLAIAAHEMGHFLAGVVLDYSWVSVTIGPLKVSRKYGPVRVSYSRTFFGGYVETIANPQDTCMRRAIYTFAGPTASLFLAFGLFLLFLHLPSSRQDACWQLVAAAAISFLFFLGSAIPHTLIGEKTDGAWLVDLWRNRAVWKDYYANRDEWNGLMDEAIAEQARHQALVEIDASARAGKRPREWNKAAVAQATFLQDGSSHEGVAAHYAFYWAEDREEPEMSERYIARALALRHSYSDAIRAKVLLDGAYHAGFRQRDALAAHALLAEARTVTETDEEDPAIFLSMMLRAEAAALLAEGKCGEAYTKAQQGLSALSAVKSKELSDQCLLQRLVTCSATNAQPTAGLSE
jgi:hypothetical protein